MEILGGHKQNLACTRTQGKGAVTPQETESDFPVTGLDEAVNHISSWKFRMHLLIFDHVFCF